MKKISKNLDKTVKLWIRNNIPDYEQCDPNIFVGELRKKPSDSPIAATQEPLAGHGFKDSIWIFEYDQNIYLGVEENAREEIQDFLSKTHKDMIFSSYGTYELSRITHKFGYYVWGPSWVLFAEENNWIDIKKHNVEVLSSDSFNKIVDKNIFWHNDFNCLKAFVVVEKEKIIASATLTDVGNNFVEIGVDTHPDSQLSGLGSTVYSAAGRWAFENGMVPFSSVGPFNIPSTRTQINSGMKYIGVDMTGTKEFAVPPQPLGKPSPNIDINDYYPEWAKNQNIYKK
jgi:hypothetical protein